MAWAVSRPEDWQLGGKCDAYMWGSGRHGQLCESGRANLGPHLTASFKCAQQVGKKTANSGLELYFDGSCATRRFCDRFRLPSQNIQW